MTLITIAQKGVSAKPAEAMGGEYIPMILSLQWIIVFEETSEISSEISAEFGFFPVSTKMKVQENKITAIWIILPTKFLQRHKPRWTRCITVKTWVKRA